MKTNRPVNPILLLQSSVGKKWSAIHRAESSAIVTTEKLQKILAGVSSTDASIVVFGSLSRKEWTSKSDVDWTLLVDGQADPEHLVIAQKVASRLTNEKFQ